jgi:hypothetical protein
MPTVAIAPTARPIQVIRDLSALIRTEYLEMPGLCLTLAQAARLWNVDTTSCQAVLDSLTREGFLRRSKGLYVIAGGSRRLPR